MTHEAKRNVPYPVSLNWNSPSHDSSGSMPLGNGDIGLNVWVEQDGDLLFYLSKTDAWDENARLLKLGRVRVTLSPNPFVMGASFRQELDLATGCIRIQSSIDNFQFSICLWVDANRPVVRVEIDAQQPVSARVSAELWRNAEREREWHEAHYPAGLRSYQDRERVFPDTVVPDPSDVVVWCHRNHTSCWSATLEHQDMAAWIPQGHDPLMNRTFGALLRGEGLVKDGACGLRTPGPRNRIVFGVHPLTAQAGTLEEWVSQVQAQADRNDEVATERAFVDHGAWWHAFWERSWIRVSGTPEAEVVSRGYELQRFINACAGRGAYPIKFNGSIFTVDAREGDKNFDADYRLWGGGYWFQNSRLIYWSMVMSGDFDLMEPWFRMYLDALPFAMARAKACFGIEDAALFPETITFWGSFMNQDYGYERVGLPPGLSENTYIRRYWQGMIELLAILLDVYAVTGDEKLLRDKLLVLAPPFLRFYRDYYQRRDDDGRILFKPAQALETWHEAVNPLPEIAGLQWVLDGLLALPEPLVPGDLREEWHQFREALPPLPSRTYIWQKRKVLIPALQYDMNRNHENAQLYAVFPYRLFGVGKPEFETGRDTFLCRDVKDIGGWDQDPIQAALLGMTGEAAPRVAKLFGTPHKGSRFPAFWGPNFDWVPDQDHGSVACITLQRMLMHWDPPAPGGSGVAGDGKIRLLPAWPQEWDVEFKLHAPGQTVVEGCYRQGKLETLTVTPTARQDDVKVSAEGVST